MCARYCGKKRAAQNTSNLYYPLKQQDFLVYPDIPRVFGYLSPHAGRRCRRISGLVCTTSQQRSQKVEDASMQPVSSMVSFGLVCPEIHEDRWALQDSPQGARRVQRSIG